MEKDDRLGRVTQILAETVQSAAWDWLKRWV